MKIMITGGAGFIGSALIRYIIHQTSDSVVNVDKLTYAANLNSLVDIDKNSRYVFEKFDICSADDMDYLFNTYQPDAVMHLAAESHVDRSINSSAEFIQTNIIGTYVLLEAARKYWLGLHDSKKPLFRFHHISTDEVYGDLALGDESFKETTPYAPSSPYSASKASSDHLVRAWHRTYSFPILCTNCSNNYGPYQFPEKLIPLIINNACSGIPLPIYGNGLQIRDWLYVEDHARALYLVMQKGRIGETYNIGGHNEKRNIDVVHMICALLEEFVPLKPKGIARYTDLITYIQDRPGHDARYAIDANKIKEELNWEPKESFETGIRKTVSWYIKNPQWIENIKNGNYQREISDSLASAQ